MHKGTPHTITEDDVENSFGLPQVNGKRPTSIPSLFERRYESTRLLIPCNGNSSKGRDRQGV
jgi:hypothetical protein